MNDELEEILSQNIAIRGFESINSDGEYFGNLDDASVEVLKEQIQAHTDKAVKEAKIDELKYLHKIAHRRKDTKMGNNTYLSAVFEKELLDRIKELQEGKE